MRVKAQTLAKDFKSSFLSAEKDQEAIWKKLFVESKPYSDKLKRLLIVNQPDCLDESKVQYRKVIDNLSLKGMKDQGYLRVVPKLDFGEHEEIKSYIILEFDDYTPSDNPQYRNCVISFTIISHLDYWEMDDYKLRPHQIAGYIDGIMDGAKLSGIGTLQFLGASQIVLNEYLGGILLRYVATHEKKEDQNPELKVE
nr:MAG TPA: hypothetical protein [Caudoviricetes sp.]